MATETKTFYPGAHNQSDYSYASISGATNPVGKGSNNTGSYATINLKTGSRATTHTRWPFDCSSIPAGATIDSVACKVAALASSTSSSYVPTRTLQLYSGTTAKGSATTISSTSRSVYTLSCGTWTRDELQSCNLYIYAQRGTSSTSTSRSIQFYGADLTVTYTYQSEKFMLKLGGAWHDIARVFKKVNGIWVEQTDLANVIGENVRYENGGEVISPAAVTITGTGNATYCYATINGTKYSGAASNIEVMPGDVITFGVYGRSSTYYGRVTIDGTQVLNVTNQTTQTYNWTVPDGVKTISIAMAYTSTSSQRNGRITVTTNNGSSENLIRFTIETPNDVTITFYAENEMTWGEWVESPYNTYGFAVNATFGDVWHSDEEWWIYDEQSDHGYIPADANIIEGHNYSYSLGDD